MAKRELQKLIADIQAKRYREGEAKGLLSSIQAEQTNALKPVLVEMAKSIGDVAKSAIEAAVKDIRVEIPEIKIPNVEVNVPEIRMPNIPAPQVRVNIPDVIVPEIKIPESKFTMPDRMNVSMDEVNSLKPLPVMMMDTKGRPMNFAMGAGGQGKADFFTIKGFSQSAFGAMVNPDGRIPVELPSGAGGLTDTELRALHIDTLQLSGSIDSVYLTGSAVSLATNIIDSSGVAFSGSNPLPVSGSVAVSGITGSTGSALIDSSGVQYSGSNPLPITGSVTLSSESITLDQETDSIAVRQVSGFVDSVVVNQIFGSTCTDLINPDNRVKVELPTGASGLTDTELRALHLDTLQLSGSMDSVAVKEIFGSAITVLLNGDNRIPVSVETGGSGLTDTELRAAHLDVLQLSGSIDSVFITGSSGSVGVTILNGEGVARDTWLVSGITNTIAAANVDSTGIQYSGSNPVPVYLVTNQVSSTMVVGAVVADAADDGSAPVKVGGISRTANPVAISANGENVSFSADDLGRQLTRPVQVRDLTVTAYASFSTGTEATLLTGVAATYLDLIYILASNNSTAAVGIDIRASTAGSVIMHLEIPANGTVGVAAPVPIPGPSLTDGTGNSWTVDLPDITGTVVYVSGLFTKEI